MYLQYFVKCEDENDQWGCTGKGDPAPDGHEQKTPGAVRMREESLVEATKSDRRMLGPILSLVG